MEKALCPFSSQSLQTTGDVGHNLQAVWRVSACFDGTRGPEMAKKAEAREIIRVVCTVDGKNYYTTTKNKRNTTERLEIMKYNPRLRKHTLHREKK
jgi:large subunit ribosomal protein L33